MSDPVALTGGSPSALLVPGDRDPLVAGGPGTRERKARENLGKHSVCSLAGCASGAKIGMIIFVIVCVAAAVIFLLARQEILKLGATTGGVGGADFAFLTQEQALYALLVAIGAGFITAVILTVTSCRDRNEEEIAPEASGIALRSPDETVTGRQEPEEEVIVGGEEALEPATAAAAALRPPATPAITGSPRPGTPVLISSSTPTIQAPPAKSAQPPNRQPPQPPAQRQPSAAAATNTPPTALLLDGAEEEEEELPAPAPAATQPPTVVVTTTTTVAPQPAPTPAVVVEAPPGGGGSN